MARSATLGITPLLSFPQHMARLKSGQWQSRAGTGLRDRTLGIYGCGRIGKRIAGCGNAFTMCVPAFAAGKPYGVVNPAALDVRR
jgi:phosphoglycerate dehydrogenase-like enzyme